MCLAGAEKWLFSFRGRAGGGRPARAALASRARDGARRVLCPAVTFRHSWDAGTREVEEPADGRLENHGGGRLGPQTCCCREPDSLLWCHVAWYAPHSQQPVLLLSP